MKVESLNEVKPLPHPNQPSSSTAQVSGAVTGGDELANVFSQEVALDTKAQGRRSRGVRIGPTEQLAHLYDQLGHPAQARLASVARRIRQELLHKPVVGTLLELTGGDPARTFVVLQQVAAQAQAEARSTEAALARDAIARLEMRYQREIQAGLNIAKVLQASSADTQERQAMRTLYYASVVTRQSLAIMMKELLGLYGGERFAIGLKVMRGALADDVAAQTSSIPTSLLRTLLRGLQSCGQLSAALCNCQALSRRLNIEQDPVGLLQRLLGYASTGIAAPEIQRLVDELWLGQPPRHLVSLNALYPVMQQLPLALWPDSRVRQEALHNFLLVMDEFARAERGPARFMGVRTHV